MVRDGAAGAGSGVRVPHSVAAHAMDVTRAAEPVDGVVPATDAPGDGTAPPSLRASARDR